MAEQKQYDVAIIGGGVVGCSILKELTSRGFNCVLCEQEDEILSGASCGNSGTLHTGFDAPLNSLELDCLKTARELNEGFFRDNSVPYRISGALIVAWTDEELGKLPDLVNHANEAGVSDVKMLSAEELRQKEPFLNPEALGAIFVPREAIVDPWSFSVSLALLGISQGGTILRGCKVNGGGRKPGGSWELSTSQGLIEAKLVINCAGLFGDTVEEINRPSPFAIKPRKGQYAVFDQSAQSLLNSIIFPVPTERTKGILVFPSVYGNIVVGPTAEDQFDRNEAKIDEKVIDMLIEKAYYIVPGLKEHKIIGTYAGLRPATQHKDYQIESLPQNNWITVGGIRSTGLSACLGIAKHISSMLPSYFPSYSAPDTPKVTLTGRQFHDNEKALVFEDQKFMVTHPLTRFGIDTSTGLLRFKSFVK